jgi:hypothetical protein
MADPTDDDVPADLQEGIERFFKDALGVVDAFARKLDSAHPPPIIYHYTDAAGLCGILASGKLWFTDIFNLNDPTELRHGLNTATKLLTAQADEGPRNAKIFANNFMAMVNGGIEEVAHYFVCCFSRAGDDLGQWRAYADNGCGYALGFKGPILDQAFAKPDGIPNPNHSTFPLTYGDDELHKMHGQIIRDVVPLITAPRDRNLSGKAINTYMSELSIALSVPVLQSALFFKHQAYRNEEEYRFLQLFQAGPVSDLRFRGRPYSLVRYRDFDWRGAAPDALKEIVIGPAADRTLALQFARDCLRAFHPAAQNVTLRRSDIPYRT